MLTKYINNVKYWLIVDLELTNWLCSGKYRVEVLKSLKRKPNLPSEIAKELQIHRSSIARILNDLVKESLVSKTTKNAKTTTYFLTEKGEKIIGELL